MRERWIEWGLQPPFYNRPAATGRPVADPVGRIPLSIRFSSKKGSSTTGRPVTDPVGRLPNRSAGCQSGRPVVPWPISLKISDFFPAQ